MALCGGAVAAQELATFPETELWDEVNADLPYIVVVDAGGTISAGAPSGVGGYGGTDPENGVRTIVEDMFPELGQIANIMVVDMATHGYSISLSGSVSTEKLYVISRTIDRYLADPEVDGVVVTAGTNVLEEDAYFLDLTVQSPKPVVMTGSMQTYGSWTYDGYNNIYNSVRLAASGLTTCFGTVVLLNDQFFDARNVTKSDGHRMDTFDAGIYGALGVASRDFVVAHRAPSRVMSCGTAAWATPFDLSTIAVEDLPAIDIISGHIESTAAPLMGVVDSGAKGVVTSGHGPGGLSSLQTDARTAALEAGVVVVSASRTGGNGNYDAGSETIGAFDMLPQKARLLLQLSLAFSNDLEQIRSWFTTIGYANFDMRNALNP